MVYAKGKKVDFALSYPLRLLIGGSLQSGKRRFIENIMNSKFSKRIKKVFYFGSDEHEKYVSGIGLPKHTDFAKDSCIIIDTLYTDCIHSDIIKSLYENSARQDLSIIITSNDLSEIGRYSNFILNNSNYIAVSLSTNKLLNRNLAEGLDCSLAFKKAYKDYSCNPYAFLTFNQSELGKSYAAIIAYISDTKVISFSSDGLKNIIFSKDRLERNFHIIDRGSDFYAIKDDEYNEH